MYNSRYPSKPRNERNHIATKNLHTHRQGADEINPVMRTILTWIGEGASSQTVINCYQLAYPQLRPQKAQNAINFVGLCACFLNTGQVVIGKQTSSNFQFSTFNCQFAFDHITEHNCKCSIRK